jgi:synaptobrevin family protein YKT6
LNARLMVFPTPGEKLDNLVAKSDNLSASSKMFYTQAKTQNSCCVVM